MLFDNYLVMEKIRNKKLVIFQLNMEILELRKNVEKII
jgi:hypothetical protein